MTLEQYAFLAEIIGVISAAAPDAFGRIDLVVGGVDGLVVADLVEDEEHPSPQ